jgi:hypothetical protein
MVGGDSKKVARSDSTGRMEQKWKGEKWKGDAKYENEVVLDLDDEVIIGPTTYYQLGY